MSKIKKKLEYIHSLQETIDDLKTEVYDYYKETCEQYSTAHGEVDCYSAGRCGNGLCPFVNDFKPDLFTEAL